MITPICSLFFLIICCYSETVSLNLTLHSVSRATGFVSTQLYVFQDAVGKYPDVDSLLNQYVEAGSLSALHWNRHVHELGVSSASHVLIARHYKYMFQTIFGQSEVDAVVVLEDDLIVSPDILQFFAATKPLLDSDPTLFAVSAWNDHGFQDMVNPESGIGEPGYFGIHRADHFPGLGWLCSRSLWEELQEKWPDFVWDVFLRTPTVRRGRHTLVSEVPRTHHIGEKGTSMHLVNFTKWFNSMELHPGADWSLFRSDQMKSLLSLDTYTDALSQEIVESTMISNFWELSPDQENTYSACYHPDLWRPIAQYLGLWPPIPLDNLPTRGLTFNGVTRVRWRAASLLLISQGTDPNSNCLKLHTLNSNLPPPPRHTMPPRLRIRAGGKGESCTSSCSNQGLWCSADALAAYGSHVTANSLFAHHLSYVDSCAAMVEMFNSACTGGCVEVSTASPVSQLLPALWYDSQQSSCLVSSGLSSSFDCAKSTPNAKRLCPCTVLA